MPVHLLLQAAEPRIAESVSALLELEPEAEVLEQGSAGAEVVLPHAVIRMCGTAGEVELRAAGEEELRRAWPLLRALAERGGWQILDPALDEPVDVAADLELYLDEVGTVPAPWYDRFVVWPLISGAWSAALWMLGFTAMVVTFWLVVELAQWGLPREPGAVGGGLDFFLQGLAFCAVLGFLGGVLVGIPLGAMRRVRRRSS